jgi:hypothetical protein
VAGALTERDFVDKLAKAGFSEVEVHDRVAVSVDDLALYPLFTEEIVELMRKLIPPAGQRAVATSIAVTAELSDGRS